MFYYINLQLHFKDGGVACALIGPFKRLKRRVEWHEGVLEAAFGWREGDVSLAVLDRKRRVAYAVSANIHPRAIIGLVERRYREYLYRLELERLGVRDHTEDED